MRIGNCTNALLTVDTGSGPSKEDNRSPSPVRKYSPPPSPGTTVVYPDGFRLTGMREDGSYSTVYPERESSPHNWKPILPDNNNQDK